MSGKSTNPESLVAQWTGAPSVELDFLVCSQRLLDDGCSEEQVEEVLAALWEIACAFVDFGFSVHPVQQACGQSGQDCLERTQERRNSVKYSLPKLIETELTKALTVPEKEEV
ncbi:hypothetical protein [Ponticaulis koreensis]|uniref:hypothetical protein n=1 Tax=Ponticaulis koreensis TaxID=1123045 RepID=UPI0003B30506|nr:hypothetical protein [Ponticaulis koreensis]